MLIGTAGMFLFAHAAFAQTGTIDSVNKYAWGENIGWLNWGTSEGNVVISDSELTGYVWGENIGWVSLNCSNTSSCATVDYKVLNTSTGNLSGYAWSENAGWINFSPGFGADPSISTLGDFQGYLWGENVGWINLNCANLLMCGTASYKVSGTWRAASGGGGGGGGTSTPVPSSSATPTPTASTTPMPTATSTASPTVTATPTHTASPRPTLLPSTTPNTTPISTPFVPPPTGTPNPSVLPSGPPAGGTPTPTPGPASEILTNVVKVISELLKPLTTVVRKNIPSVSMGSAAGVVASAVTTVASLASSGVNLFNFFEFLFKNILVIFGLKKKTKSWGTIYNSVTKQPVPYTKIQLLGPDMRAIETRISDKLGRYGFLVDTGDTSRVAVFSLLPLHDKFRFPSQRPLEATDRVIYRNFYSGGPVQVSSQGVFNFDIPLDPLESNSLSAKRPARLAWYAFFNAISRVLFWVALITVPLNYFFYPSLLNLVILIVFAGLNLIILAGDLRQHSFGLVLDKLSRTPVPYSLITLNDVSGQRKNFAVADEHGRYFLLSDQGKYTVSAFTPAQINPPRTTNEPFATDRGWVAKKIQL